MTYQVYAMYKAVLTFKDEVVRQTANRYYYFFTFHYATLNGNKQYTYELAKAIQ